MICCIVVASPASNWRGSRYRGVVHELVPSGIDTEDKRCPGPSRRSADRQRRNTSGVNPCRLHGQVDPGTTSCRASEGHLIPFRDCRPSFKMTASRMPWPRPHGGATVLDTTSSPSSLLGIGTGLPRQTQRPGRNRLRFWAFCVLCIARYSFGSRGRVVPAPAAAAFSSSCSAGFGRLLWPLPR